MRKETHHWRYGIESDRNSVKGSGRMLCIYCSDDLNVNPEFVNDGDADLHCERCLLKIIRRPQNWSGN